MANPFWHKFEMDDDQPRACSHPTDDALSSAQARRFAKSLIEENSNDYSYSD